MIHLPESRLDYFLHEDVPSIDLTVEVLGIGDVWGEIEFYTREDCVLCCTEEVARIMHGLDIKILDSRPSGTQLIAGESFLLAEAQAGSLHTAWKVCLNLFDHYSAIATKTKRMVDEVKKVNPHCEVLTTRKSMPGTKDLMIKAVMTGGAFPHRLGLSETILVFDHHREFLGGFDSFVDKLPEFKRRCVEKKFFVEANADQARILATKGVDGIQFDKIPSSDLTGLVKDIRTVDDRVTLIAAGGINLQNAAEYAATGVDGIVTTSLFTAKPVDMSVRMSRK